LVRDLKSTQQARQRFEPGGSGHPLGSNVSQHLVANLDEPDRHWPQYSVSDARFARFFSSGCIAAAVADLEKLSGEIARLLVAHRVKRAPWYVKGGLSASSAVPISFGCSPKKHSKPTLQGGGMPR